MFVLVRLFFILLLVACAKSGESELTTGGSNDPGVVYDGVNLEVPIDMFSRELASANANRLFERSMTTLNTNDYVGESAEYYFEIVAKNTESFFSAGVMLINSNNTVPTGSIITVEPNVSDLTRYRVKFTPTTGDDIYRVRIQATDTGNSVVVTQARIIVKQKNATATKIYIPLAGTNINGFTNSLTTGITTSTSLTYTQPLSLVSYFYEYTRNDSAYRDYAAGNAFTFETLSRTLDAAQTSSVALYNKTTNQPVTGVETHVTGDTAIQLKQVSFSTATANFTDGDKFDVRIKTTDAAQAVNFHKAGLWIKLENLEKAEIYYHLSRQHAAASSIINPNQRFLWEEANWSNPKVFFEVGSSVSTGSITLLADTSDSATTGLSVAGSEMTPDATLTTKRSPEIALTNGHRYYVFKEQFSGAVQISYGFLVISVEK